MSHFIFLLKGITTRALLPSFYGVKKAIFHKHLHAHIHLTRIEEPGNGLANILPKSVVFDSLARNSATGISILLPGPSSTAEKATLSGSKLTILNERNLKTETNLTKAKQLC